MAEEQPGYTFLRGWKAPGYGKKKGGAGPFVPSQAHIVGLGSNPATDFRPSSYSAWNNKNAFADWQGGLDEKDPGRGYKWVSKDIDGDNVPEGLVYDGDNMVGINGYRLKKPVWTKNTQWRNPDGQIENMYEKRYQSRNEWNAEHGVTTLKGLRAQVGSEIVGPFMATEYGKGSIERKVPRSQIVAFLIAAPQGGNGAALDNAWLGRWAGQYPGIPPSQLLSAWHKDPDYKNAVNENLTNAVTQGQEEAKAAIRQFVRFAVQQRA
jgi:hypothetical protein